MIIIILGRLFLSPQCPCWLPPTESCWCWYVQRWQHLLPQLNPASLVPYPRTLQFPDGQQLARLKLQRGTRKRIHPELHLMCNDTHP
jgi:hypothetical protein